MKTENDINSIKEEVVLLNRKLKGLSEEQLEEISDGCVFSDVKELLETLYNSSRNIKI